MIPADLNRHVKFLWEDELGYFPKTAYGYYVDQGYAEFKVGLVLRRCACEQSLFVPYIFQQRLSAYGNWETLRLSENTGYRMLKKAFPSMVNVSNGTWLTFDPADEALLKMFFGNGG